MHQSRPSLYSDLLGRIQINKADLMTAIRCYFIVQKDFNLKDSFKTFDYLNFITEKRGFFASYSRTENIEVFRTYLKTNIAKASKIHGLSVLDCKTIVNSFKNILIADILKDLQAEKLMIYDYQQPKKRTTNKQLKIEWEQLVSEMMN